MICVLAGGVGAARFLTGLQHVVEPDQITAIVNVGDDTNLHGLHISPDIDTVTYTLAGAIDPDRGWGLKNETWHAMESLGQLGGDNWFNLGDRDLGTHLYRTGRLAKGASLSDVTTELATRWGVGVHIVPVTNDRLRTFVTITDPDQVAPHEVPFQEYFVGRQHQVPVSAIRFDGAQTAVPAPGVLDAMRSADLVVIAPSNPLVSIAPLLAVPGVADALRDRRAATVAISPIVAGEALKGPADHMMRELGHESSVVGVARLYAEYATTLVIDDADAGAADAVRGQGIDAVVTPTIMSTSERSAGLAQQVLAIANIQATP